MILMIQFPRANPAVCHSREFFLSIATGLLLILYAKLFQPIFQIDYTLPPAMPSLLAVCFLRLLGSSLHHLYLAKTTLKTLSPKLSLMELLFPTCIRLSMHLCLVKLIQIVEGLTFSIIALCVLTIMEVFSKLSRRGCGWKRADLVSYLLIGVVFSLEPIEYASDLSLHLNLFLIVSTCLLAVSYYYVHMQALAITEDIPLIQLKELLIEAFVLLTATGYLLYDGETQEKLLTQTAGLLNNKLCLAAMALVCTLLETAMLESLRHIEAKKICLLQATGLMWYNLQYLINFEVTTRMCLATLFLGVLLLKTMEVCSQENARRCGRWMICSQSKKELQEE